jgi:hypothetical protein
VKLVTTDPCFGKRSTIRGIMASISLELDEHPDAADSIMYAIMGDMFDLEIEIEDGVLKVTGKKRDIWSWLSFTILWTLGEI